MSQQCKVLILEDDVLVAWSLRELLSLTGYEVTGVAATVSDALYLAENTITRSCGRRCAVGWKPRRDRRRGAVASTVWDCGHLPDWRSRQSNG